MKQRRVLAIGLFTVLSLAGLVLVQMLWIKAAIQLYDSQFDHRVDLALHETINEMDRVLPERGPCPEESAEDSMDCSYFMKLDQQLLDSLLQKYLRYHQLDQAFAYRIMHTARDSIIFAQGVVGGQVYQKSYKACLSCLYQKEIFHIELAFPERSRVGMFETRVWLGFSIFFLLAVMLGFFLIIHYTLRLREMNEVKNDFINNMNHEFQTPISTISLAAEVLKKSAGGNVSKEIVNKYAGIIFEETLRLRSNVQRVLQVAAAEQGSIRFERSLFDLNQLVHDTVRNLCLEECDKHVHVEFDLQACPSLVCADVVHMSNIISNLVENAVKYTGVSPEINIQSVNQEDGIVISFCDNGPGIPLALQKKVFDKFYSRTNSTSEGKNGFGLGLFYVKTMIEAHGGWVELLSETGKGCRFNLYIPYGRDFIQTPTNK